MFSMGCFKLERSVGNKCKNIDEGQINAAGWKVRGMFTFFRHTFFKLFFSCMPPWYIRILKTVCSYGHLTPSATFPNWQKFRRWPQDGYLRLGASTILSAWIGSLQRRRPRKSSREALFVELNEFFALRRSWQNISEGWETVRFTFESKWSWRLQVIFLKPWLGRAWNGI